MAGLAILLGKSKKGSDDGMESMEDSHESGSKSKFAELADVLDEAISSGGLGGSLKRQFVDLMSACYQDDSEMDEAPESKKEY